MAVFLWQAHTRAGEARSGEMEAPTPDAVKDRLRAQNLQVDKVKKKPLEIVIRMPGSTGVTTQDLVLFTRQFATMLDAGLPLVQCLEILGSQLENQEFRKVIMDVKGTVESGTTLADALRKHPKVFDRLYVNLVAAGETGGVLDTILVRLATYLEKSVKLVRQVKSALTYPVLVIVAAFVVTLVLLVWVIPVFEKMFADFGGALPWLTQTVVDLSDFTRGNIIYILGVIGGTVAAAVYFRASKFGREFTDRAMLRAPIFGPLLQKIAVAKFTRTLATMLSSGVNILEALEIVSGTAGNVVVEAGLRQVKQKISEGMTMAAPLAETKIFPPMVVQMISVGEATGAMDSMLGKIADFYDDEVDAGISQMLSMLEPLIMTGLSVVLGVLVISMYLPVFTLAGSMG